VKIGKKESPPEPVFPDHDFVNGNDKGNHFLGERIKPDGFVFKKGSLWILIYIECIIKWKARGVHLGPTEMGQAANQGREFLVKTGRPFVYVLLSNFHQFIFFKVERTQDAFMYYQSQPFDEAIGFAHLHNLLSQGPDFLGANHFPPIEGVTVGDVLGKGATSNVYRGILTDTKESVAIKHVSEQYQEQAANELEILRSLKNDHIPTIPLNDLPERVVVLSPVLKSVANFTLEDAHQLITALKYVHKQGYFHRDIRPANVMKSEEGRIFLVDFGFAIRQNDAAAASYAGTLTTASDRVLQKLFDETKDVGFLVADDVQSLAKTVYPFVTKEQPEQKKPRHSPRPASFLGERSAIVEDCPEG